MQIFASIIRLRNETVAKQTSAIGFGFCLLQLQKTAYGNHWNKDMISKQ